MEELIDKFSLERVHKAGAKFDFEKAKWFNHQYILKKDDSELVPLVRPYVEAQGLQPDQDYLTRVIGLIKERCHLLSEFWDQGHFFFRDPEEIDLGAIKDKWSPAKQDFFVSWAAALDQVGEWTDTMVEKHFTEHLTRHGLKKGEVLLPLRVMLVGGKYGPGVFHIAEMIGRESTKGRVEKAVRQLS